ncbi:hypothetical protein EYF80_022580 [Liparis tanakae]|uniref:Uncharacterized protein n=1 Tax=Liparis tanakae TaxID=230148 RepID=A0A4Z2HQ79_9TELE|nr:hypothetical protein EYF80_022580 [Liparis tanakae]
MSHVFWPKERTRAESSSTRLSRFPSCQKDRDVTPLITQQETTLSRAARFSMGETEMQDGDARQRQKTETQGGDIR